MTLKEIRKYYRHLADQERRRATRAALEARFEHDTMVRIGLEALATTHSTNAGMYDRLHDECHA